MWLDLNPEAAEIAGLMLWFLWLVAFAVAGYVWPGVWRASMPAVVACFALLVLGRIQRAGRQLRIRRVTQGFPETMQDMGVTDGQRTVAVTLGNGETRMIQVDADYDAQTDGGELLLREACPELFVPGGPLFEAAIFIKEQEGDDAEGH